MFLQEINCPIFKLSLNHTMDVDVNCDDFFFSTIQKKNVQILNRLMKENVENPESLSSTFVTASELY